MPQWAVLLERGKAHLLCPLLSRSVADGGAKATHLPYGGEASCIVADGASAGRHIGSAGCPSGRRMGQPVCAPASSSGGEGGRSDDLASRPLP